MRVEKRIDIRDGRQDLRFVFHVVEGADNQNPGRIRTIRLDDNGGGEPWLLCEWEGTSGKQRGKLAAVHIKNDMAKLGAFFLLDAYADDPNETRRARGPELWSDWSRRRERGEPVGQFPAEWLPQRVQDLQALGRAAASAPWAVPSLEEVELGLDESAA